METLTFTRCRNLDVNGNPRYVVHFLALNTRAELDANPWIDVSEKYSIALSRAHSLGGRKYHNKRYGGGIVFQSYSIDELARYISQATGRTYTAERDNRDC